MIQAIPVHMTSEANAEAETSDPNIRMLTVGMVEGSSVAFRQFCETFGPRLRRYCLTRVKGDDDASYEVYQDTLIRIARYPKEIGDEVSLWRWLKSIVRSALIDRARRNNRYQEVMRLYWDEVNVRQVSPLKTDHQLTSLLSEELSGMPDSEREVLEKKYLEGWSYQAIGEALQISPKAVESRLTRARVRLRELIKERLQS